MSAVWSGSQSTALDTLSNARTVVTTTRVRDDIETTLTNIDTKSDAWGKIIPLSFGRCRVGGALIWSSQFYKTTETFDDVTTTQSLVDYQSIPTVPPVPYIKSQSDGGQTIAWGDPREKNVIGPPDFITGTRVRDSGSQVTHGSETGSYIDLCYSFGKEGDPRQKRYVEKIRINDIIVYDTTTDYLADGLALSIRYGYNNAPPALMQRYENGKFHYKDQTLVVFDRFPLAQFGDAVPNSVDVEFGCCAGIASTPRFCDFHQDVNNYGNNGPLFYGKGDLSFYTYQPGDLLLYICRYKIGASVIVDDSFETIKGSNQGIYSYICGAKTLNAAEALELQNGLRQLTNAKANIMIRSYSAHNGEPMPAGSIRQAAWTFVPAGQRFQHITATADGYGLNIKFGTDVQANDLDGIFIDDSHPCQVGQPVGFESENDVAPDGGWMVFSAVVATPCTFLVG